MLQYGIIGGSKGSFIADVHIRALEATRKARLTSACFSRNPQKSAEAAEYYHVAPERTYRTYDEMARAEASRPDGIRFVVIAAPNYVHFPCAKTFLEHGISVACDKPVAFNAQEAEILRDIARKNGLLFCVTYTFAGLPSLRHIRKLVTDGILGQIRMVVGENVQDWLANDTESGDIAPWRMDPKSSGKSNCLADIGSHVEFAAHFTTGLVPQSVCCMLDRYDYTLDATSAVMVRYLGGARGIYWATQVGFGNDNGMRLRIYGEKGSIEWANEQPEIFLLTLAGQPTMRIVKGKHYREPSYYWQSWLPSGHAEGWYCSFANIYEGFLSALNGEENAYYPSIEDGVRGMRFIDACLESDQKQGIWITL